MAGLRNVNSSQKSPSVDVLAMGHLADPEKGFTFARKFSTPAENVNIYTNAAVPFLRRRLYGMMAKAEEVYKRDSFRVCPS